MNTCIYTQTNKKKHTHTDTHTPPKKAKFALCYRLAKTHRMPCIHITSCKRALWLLALLRKESCSLRHPMHLRHPVGFLCEIS